MAQFALRLKRGERRRMVLVSLLALVLGALGLADYFDLIPVPPTLWSVVAGAGLTLVGVLVSNDAAADRFEDQQYFESSEKTKERIGKARLEIYRGAVEAMVKAGGHLGRLCDVDMSKEGLLDALGPLSAASSELQLVADTRAALLVSGVATSYTEWAFKLLPSAMRVQGLSSERQIKIDMRASANAEMNRVLAAMRQDGESERGADSKERFDRLLATFDFERARAEKLSDEINELSHKESLLRLEYMKEALDSSAKLMQETLDALIALRNDLDLATDADVYMEGLTADRLRIVRAMEGLLPQLDQMIEEERNP